MLKILTTFIYILFLLQISVFPSFASEFTGTPKEIIIPSLKVVLPVVAAQITYDTWEVSEVGASFGVGTSLPGHKGNTVIFAHARENLFASLPDIDKGEYVHVFTDKDWFVYQVYETKTVEPQDVTVLVSQKARELTLFTCFGTSYEQRYIVKAKLMTDTTSFGYN